MKTGLLCAIGLILLHAGVVLTVCAADVMVSHLVPPRNTVCAISATAPISSLAFKSHVANVRWCELEPSPRKYSIGKIGNPKLLVIEPIHGIHRVVPKDLSNVKWNAPEMRSRFHGLVDALRPVLGNAQYVSIGHDVDAYLTRSNEPGVWEKYTAFYKDAAEYIHKVAPRAKVGTGCQYSAFLAAPKIFRKLNAPSDVIIVTYYPLADEFSVQEPNAPYMDVDNIVHEAGQKLVVFEEVGYPTDSDLGGSEQKQFEFFKNFFFTWREHAAAIPFVNVYAAKDRSPAEAAAEAGSYGLSNVAAFREFLGSLGLLTHDGKQKIAYKLFATQTANASKRSK